MEKVVLQATRRTVTGKQVRAIRREGLLPGIMYGHHFDPTPISLDLHTSTLALAGLSSSSLIYLNLEGSEHASLIREKQRDFIRGTLKHIDFQVVSLTEKIRADVNIEITGIFTRGQGPEWGTCNRFGSIGSGKPAAIST